MTTKEIGMIGEAKILSYFKEKGIPVSIPFGDNYSYALIAEFNGKLNKIQIKTSASEDPEKTSFKISKTRINSFEIINKYYSQEEVDYYALYSINRQEIYLVPFKEAPLKEINIRHLPPKNNQFSKIKMDKDYLIEKILKL